MNANTRKQENIDAITIDVMVRKSHKEVSDAFKKAQEEAGAAYVKSFVKGDDIEDNIMNHRFC